MPIYTYICRGCQQLTEGQRPVAERDFFPDCPTCKHRMQRWIAPANVNLHGSQSSDPITQYQFKHLFKD